MNIFSKRLQIVKDDTLLSVVRDIPFFGELTRREIREIVDVLQIQSFEPKEEVFTQGQPGLGMFIVTSGKVEIVQAEEDGSERVLSEADSGSFFGEMALLDDAARSATARAVEKTELVAFYRSDLLALAEEKSQLGVKIIMYLSQVVAERLRRTNRSLKEVRDELESVKVDSEEVDGA